MEENARTKTGQCFGGPLDGQERSSRYPKGFLLVDRQQGLCWLYDAPEGQAGFVCRDPAGEPLVEDPNANRNRWRAAEEFSYDVLAYAEEGAP